MLSRVLFIAVMLFGLVGCAGKSSSTSSDPKTVPPAVVEKALSAREAFRLADAVAKKWKADAKLYAASQRGVLQQVSASPNGEKTWDFADVKTGQSRRWVFEYFSVESLAVLFTSVLDGKVDSFPSSKFSKKPMGIPDNWVDSTDAMKSARESIEKALNITQDKYMALSKLRMVTDPTGPVWLIEFYQSHGDASLYGAEIDALSGKLTDAGRPQK